MLTLSGKLYRALRRLAYLHPTPFFAADAPDRAVCPRPLAALAEPKRKWGRKTERRVA